MILLILLAAGIGGCDAAIEYSARAARFARYSVRRVRAILNTRRATAYRFN